jgi:hypothetical protein
LTLLKKINFIIDPLMKPFHLHMWFSWVKTS